MLLLGEYNQSFGRKGQGGWEDNIIMHFFFFLEERGKILHTLGLKVHKFMGSLSTAKL